MVEQPSHHTTRPPANNVCWLGTVVLLAKHVFVCVSVCVAMFVLLDRIDHAFLCPRPLCIHYSCVSPTTLRTDAIRFALDRGTPEGCEPLVSTVVDQTRIVLQDGGKGRDDYSVLVSTR